MAKSRKFYESLNQPKANPNGKHRRPNSKAHRNPDQQPDQISGRTVSIPAATWRTLNSRATIISYKAIEPTPIPYAGIRTGEIIGHRAWRVVDDGLGSELCSLAHFQIWRRDEVIYGDINKVIDMDYFSRFMTNPLMHGVYAHFTAEQVIDQTKEQVAKSYPIRCPKDQLTMHQQLEYFAFGSAIYETIVVHGLVYGTVELWGEVVEHELGWRAEYAKLKSLDRFVGEFDFQKLKERYGV